jgi:GNAT superfamily N-acetyltransferase
MSLEIEIDSIDNTSAAFYNLIGPFLARRSIEKEVGGRMYDDDGKTWFLATINAKVVGFCAGIPRRQDVHFVSAYVLPDYRGKGVYRKLCDARDAFFAGKPARVTCKKENLKHLRSLGFKLKRKKGETFYELHRA